jgi:acyl dehydratase
MYFEDYLPGAVYETGATTVAEADILDFARRFDPQPMHVDPAAAAHGQFGGLIASGWHTAAMTMRLLADHFLHNESSIASPGIDELRWLKPVRPGDALRLRITVIDKTRSRSKPDRGIVRTLVEVLNQHDERVMTMKPMNLFRCRDPQPPSRHGRQGGRL